MEDPVEKALDFVTHFETWVNPQNPEETMTFGDYLKSIVRLDGDYVFLGEMRDAETIMNATQLASIGYSIYSTMHVGSVFALKSRVEKYGVEFPSLAESLKGVIVQELLPEYDEVSCKYLKDFTDADIETQLPIIREIWRYGKGISTEPSPMLSRFHRKVMKFKPLINNNLVYSEDKHPGFKRLKDSLETYDTFVKFLYDAFKTDVNKAIPGTKGMKLVFEVLPVDDENRDAYASGDKNSVY